MKQARRGMAHTALSVGTDISSRISRVYAPPTAWSLGYLWGADTVTIPAGATFAPADGEGRRAGAGRAAASSGTGDMVVLELELAGGDPDAERRAGRGPARAPADRARRRLRGRQSVAFAETPALAGARGRRTRSCCGAWRRLRCRLVEPVARRGARIAVLAASNNQEVWALRELGYVADADLDRRAERRLDRPAGRPTTRSSTRGRGRRRRNTVARTRLSAFFARGGGYVGGGTNAGAFLVVGGEVAGLATANRSGNGRSGIINWVRESAASPITGAYPERDTAIVDPPVWFTSVPASMAVDGRLPQSHVPGRGPVAGRRAVGQRAGRGGDRARHEHARARRGMAVFAMNPLYRAIPEREWPMLASALNWSAAGPGVAVRGRRGRRRSAASVPATLSLTLGAPASFGAFTPGVARDYDGGDDGERDLDAPATRR